MTTLATDSFNRANNADLGTAWDVNISSFKIDTNNAKNAAPTSADSAERNNSISWPNDQWSEATLGSVTAGQGGSNGYGAAVRMDTGGAANFYNVFGNNLGWNIARMDAGANTTLASGASPAFATGDVIYLEMVGSQPTAKRNGSALGSPGTDSTYSAGSAGVYCSGDSGMSVNDGIDSWQGGDFLSASTSVSGPFQARGAGQGPMLMRRRMLQRFPDVAPPDPGVPARLWIGDDLTDMMGPGRRRAPQRYPDTIIPPSSPGGPNIWRTFRGRGGPPARLRITQAFPDTPVQGVVVNGKVGAYNWAGVPGGIAVSIAGKIGNYTWTGKAGTLSVEVSGKVGSWTWAGVQGKIATSISGKVGAWTWVGVTGKISVSVSGRVGVYTWAGLPGNFGQTVIINGTIGAYTWVGKHGDLPKMFSGTPGQYTWAGVHGTVPRVVYGTVGQYTWSGNTGSIVSMVAGPPGAWTWTGKSGTFGTITVPTTRRRLAWVGAYYTSI